MQPVFEDSLGGPDKWQRFWYNRVYVNLDKTGARLKRETAQKREQIKRKQPKAAVHSKILYSKDTLRFINDTELDHGTWPYKTRQQWTERIKSKGEAPKDYIVSYTLCVANASAIKFST